MKRSCNGATIFIHLKFSLVSCRFIYAQIYTNLHLTMYKKCEKHRIKYIHNTCGTVYTYNILKLFNKLSPYGEI